MQKMISRSDIERFYRLIVDDNFNNVCEYLNRFEFDKFDIFFQKRYNASIVQKICQNDSFNTLENILKLNQSHTMRLMNFRDFENKTALHHCALFNTINCASLLLNLGANVDSLKRGDTTPLMIAAHKNHFEMFVLLMKYNSKYNVKDSNSWNCGHIASRIGSLSILKQLYDFYANDDAQFWNEKTKNGSTMLHIAAHNGHIDIVDFLLNHNKVFDNKNLISLDSEGKTPFFRSILSNNIKLIERLFDCQQMTVNDTDLCQRTALYYAVLFRSKECVIFLVEKLNCNIDALDMWEQSPIFVTIRNHDVELLKYLVNHGANLQVKDKNGNTFKSLCDKAYPELLKSLAIHKAL